MIFVPGEFIRFMGLTMLVINSTYYENVGIYEIMHVGDGRVCHIRLLDFELTTKMVETLLVPEEA